MLPETIELTPEQEAYIKSFVGKRFPDKEDARREGYEQQLRKAIRTIQLSNEEIKN